MFSFVSKLINKLVKKRNYLTQKVCYILYGLPLQKDNRMVQIVNCRLLSSHNYTINVSDFANKIEESTTSYNKYLRRLLVIKDVSYFEFLKS